MNFFRNPEIRRMTVIYLLITVISVSGTGFMVQYLTKNGQIAVLVCAAVSALCFVFAACYYVPTYLRYQKIRKLSQELENMLHENHVIPFSDYSEGELSVLEIELSKLTQKLAEQADALEADKRYLSEAMADISHQLRSPLTAGQLILSLLKEPDIGENRKRELLQELAHIFSHMGWLVEALLKMAKMDANMAYLKHEPVLVRELVHKVLEPLLIQMELRNQQIHMEGITDTAQFIGDFSWSCEAVFNVIKNCMEHITQGGNIWIVCKETPLYLELLIEDDGAGFCNEDIPHLFERFYKGQNATSQSIGIGLALTRMILSEENATIKAENCTGKGARFLIRFYTKKEG